MKRRKYYLVFWLLILSSLLISPLKSQDLCEEIPFPELNRETLLEKFSSLIEGGATPKQAFDQVANFIIQRAKGKRLIRDQGQSCYKVAGVNISMNYSVNRKKFPTLVKQVGVVRGAQDHVVIAFSYDRHGIKGGKEFQEIYDVRGTIALRLSPPDELVLSSDKSKLRPGESATIIAKLMCGGYPMKMKEISFQWKGPGELSPINTSTGRDGIAETTFKAKEKGKAIVTAYYYDKLFGVKKASISLEIIELTHWDIEIITDYTAKMEYRVHSWGSQARFENIPLFRWEPGLPPIFLYHESKGHFTYAKFSAYDGEKYIMGVVQGDPIWCLTVLPKREELESGEIKTVVLGFGLPSLTITPAPTVRITYPGHAHEGLEFFPLEPLEIPFEKLEEGKPFSMEQSFEDEVGKGKISFKFTPAES